MSDHNVNQDLSKEKLLAGSTFQAKPVSCITQSHQCFSLWPCCDVRIASLSDQLVLLGTLRLNV
jgi:hypothetical protein